MTEAFEGREIVLGRNSKVWAQIKGDPAIGKRFSCAISHYEINSFSFRSTDRVWVFSYSRNPLENSRMLANLQVAGVNRVVYISSAATLVTRLTRCYQYPRVKALAEAEARSRMGAQILVLGLVYRAENELPAGLSAATSIESLKAFMLAPKWIEEGGSARHLFEPVVRPFGGALESTAYRLYGVLVRCVGRWPCVLRPLDQFLRVLGWHWYGYFYLSNRLWYSTTS